MPEGDTIYRTARTLQQWLGGRVITEAHTSISGVAINTVIGRMVSSVEPVGKNVLMRFAPPPDATEPEFVLHTHMRMTGSWHVYPIAVPWKRPMRQARVVLTASDRVAVCFNAPVVELRTAEAITRRLRSLGPDILSIPMDVEAISKRTEDMRADRSLGEVLLDQRVVCGIGNIYRCEALFHQRIHPWHPFSSLSSEAFVELLAVAARFMHANLRPGAEAVGREFDGGRGETWVYRRAGLPCRICGTLIQSRPQGEQARVAYWCPTCQVKSC